MNGKYTRIDITKEFFDDFGPDKILTIFKSIIEKQPNFLFYRHPTDASMYVGIFTDQLSFRLMVRTEEKDLNDLVKETVFINSHAKLIDRRDGHMRDDFTRNNMTSVLTFQFND